MPKKNYFQESQTREFRLSEFVSKYLAEFVKAKLDIKGDTFTILELNKERYSKKGDVDIAFLEFKKTNNYQIINTHAIEIKTCVYERKTKKFKSIKAKKHLKQIKNLVNEGWENVYLLDILITEPLDKPYEPSEKVSLEMQENFDKEIGIENCGHLILTWISYTKDGMDAGGSCPMIIKKRGRKLFNENTIELKKNLEAFLKNQCQIKDGNQNYDIRDSNNINKEPQVVPYFTFVTDYENFN